MLLRGRRIFRAASLGGTASANPVCRPFRRFRAKSQASEVDQGGEKHAYANRKGRVNDFFFGENGQGGVYNGYSVSSYRT